MIPREPSCTIVGASAAGVSAAIEMRRGGFTGSVVIVDSDPHLPYERPPLSKTLFGSAGQELVPIYPTETYSDLGIDLRVGQRALELDIANRRVRTGDGEVIPSDIVVLATGLAARRLDVAGSVAPNVLTLRDAADAQALSLFVKSGGPLVIVGAGFIGLEMASVAREHGVDVTVVEASPYPLSHSVGPVVASFLIDLHREQGVKFVLGATVTELTGTAHAAEQVWLSDGQGLDASAIVVGVGAEPNLELARNAGVHTDPTGIVVDHLGQTNIPNVFAAGDVAVREHSDLLRPSRIEHWDSSVRHGSAVGATIAGSPTTVSEPIYAWSDQYGSTLQIVGRVHPTDQFVLRDGANPAQFLGYWIRDGRIGAAAGLGASREIAVLKRMISQKLPVSPEELRDRDVDLRRSIKSSRSVT
ncbi:FAD-dependent oxidoreductase [Rhodococcus sp. MEB032]|uniref:NAD(P)/FAD-dependent oxidoreductase n=1 Tax=Rhodococcus sp. MEB032 TaxID=3040322 RepID=UPI0025512101|nr:FAD-dependent oxidoreductase [Rhodococcus sp. MEB032]